MLLDHDLDLFDDTEEHDDPPFHLSIPITMFQPKDSTVNNKMDTSNLCHRFQPASGSKKSRVDLMGYPFELRKIPKIIYDETVEATFEGLVVLNLQKNLQNYPPSSFTFFYHSKPHRLKTFFHIFTLHRLEFPDERKLRSMGTPRNHPTITVKGTTKRAILTKNGWLKVGSK